MYLYGASNTLLSTVIIQSHQASTVLFKSLTFEHNSYEVFFHKWQGYWTLGTPFSKMEAILFAEGPIDTDFAGQLVSDSSQFYLDQHILVRQVL